jgi:hypothetical protein
MATACSASRLDQSSHRQRAEMLEQHLFRTLCAQIVSTHEANPPIELPLGVVWPIVVSASPSSMLSAAHSSAMAHVTRSSRSVGALVASRQAAVSRSHSVGRSASQPAIQPFSQSAIQPFSHLVNQLSRLDYPVSYLVSQPIRQPIS